MKKLIIFLNFLMISFSLSTSAQAGDNLKGSKNKSDLSKKNDSLDYYKKFALDLLKEKEYRQLTVHQKKKLHDSLNSISPKKIAIKDSTDYYKVFSDNLLKSKEERYLAVNLKKKFHDSFNIVVPKNIIVKDSINYYDVFSDNLVKSKEERIQAVNQRKKLFDSINQKKIEDIKLRKNEKISRVVDIKVEPVSSKVELIELTNEEANSKDLYITSDSSKVAENNSYKTLFDYGKEMLENENYETALAHFNECIKRKYYDIYAIYYKGITLRKMKRYDDAIDTFRDLFSLDQTYFIVNYEIGKIHLEREEYPHALYNFNQYLINNPHSHEAQYYKAVIYYETKKEKQALEFITKAIKGDDRNAEYYNLAGKIRLGLKSTNAGCQDLQRAIDLNHPNALEIFTENCLKKT